MAQQRLDRKEYLDKLVRFRDKQLIKVVTGVRRCGKSTLLEIYQDYLRADGVDEKQIVSINLEDFDFLSLRDPAALHTYVKERLVPGRMTYVFVDEIQHCVDFPTVIDSLSIRKNVDVYLTGSNAYMLSGEIATLISGRYVIDAKSIMGIFSLDLSLMRWNSKSSRAQCAIIWKACTTPSW